MVDVTATGSATTAPPEPRRSDYVHSATDVTEQPAETQEDPPHDPKTGAQPAADRWFAKATGQESIAKEIVRLLKEEAKTAADIEAIDKANAERVAKFTQANRAAINNARDDRLEDLRAAG
jgi:hypothetical protein